jgi:hypothetical protein
VSEGSLGSITLVTDAGENAPERRCHDLGRLGCPMKFSAARKRYFKSRCFRRSINRRLTPAARLNQPCEIQLRNLYLSGAIFSVFLSVSPLFSVFLKTKVPNGICLSPRLSKNLSQALRTDKIWPGRRSLNFSSSRLESEPRDPTGLSLHNRARKTYLLFINLDLYIKYFEQSLYLF